MRLRFTVFAIANRADRFCGAGSCSAGAVVCFRVAFVALAGTGVRVVAVRSPRAPIVAEDVAGCEGGFIGCALGAQTADGARLVVDCFFCAGRGIFQVLLCCRFSGEVMCIHFAVFAAAILADCFLRAGGCAARAVVRFRVACISGADAGMCVIAVGSPCAPVVTEDVAGCEGGFIGCALGTQAADGAGFVIDRFFRAGCGGFQIHFLRCFCRKAVFLENSLNGHIAGRHNKAVFRDVNVAAEHFPLLEVIALVGLSR